MGRVEKFKEVRKFRIKCTLILVFFLMLVFTGVCVSDYSINTLMNNQKKITIIEVEKKDNTNIFISFLNLGLNLDTTYISKDLENIKRKVKKMFGY